MADRRFVVKDSCGQYLARDEASGWYHCGHLRDARRFGYTKALDHALRLTKRAFRCRTEVLFWPVPLRKVAR